jgi:hypothetical protein
MNRGPTIGRAEASNRRKYRKDPLGETKGRPCRKRLSPNLRWASAPSDSVRFSNTAAAGRGGTPLCFARVDSGLAPNRGLPARAHSNYR